jgi:hypothetical protein
VAGRIIVARTDHAITTQNQKSPAEQGSPLSQMQQDRARPSETLPNLPSRSAKVTDADQFPWDILKVLELFPVGRICNPSGRIANPSYREKLEGPWYKIPSR